MRQCRCLSAKMTGHLQGCLGERREYLETYLESKADVMWSEKLTTSSHDEEIENLILLTK